MGALARGELRVGLVDGRFSVNAAGAIEDGVLGTGDTVGGETAGGEGCLSGEPGRVVVLSFAGAFPLSMLVEVSAGGVMGLAGGFFADASSSFCS